MTDSSSILAQLVANTDRLFTPPALAVEVLELCRNPRVDAQALKRCIERDPALTAKLLKTANSSLFGARRQITDLTQALSLMGTKALKLLVLSFSLPEDLFAGQDAEALALYWRHTLMKAVAARELAERIWRLPGEEAFVAGLLQDIGELVLLQQLGEPYWRFVKQVAEQGGDLVELETQSLGFDHTLLSARLLRHWGLPESLLLAVGRRADALTTKESFDVTEPLVEILCLAELLARLFSQQQPYALREVLDRGERTGRLNYGQLQDLVATLDEQVADLGDAFALYPTGGPTLAELLVQANAQLGDLAFDLLADASRLTQELKAAIGGALSIRTTASAHCSKTAPASLIASRPPAQAASIRSGEPDFPSSRSSLPENATPDPGLIGRVTTAIQRGRQNRQPVSLVLLQLDRFSDFLFAVGPQRAAAVARLLEAAIAQLAAYETPCLPVGEGRYALLWQDCDRRDAAEAGRMLMKSLAEWFEARGDGGVTFSLGIATVNAPPRNFPPRELLVTAERCLSAALLSGGNCLKSLDV